MEIQDKVGRDEAQRLLDKFEYIHQNDPAKIEIFKNTKLYKFFINKHPDFGRLSARNGLTGKIILPFELFQLVKVGIINQETSDNLTNMLNSEHAGDLTIAESAINMYRQKRLKKHGRIK